MEITGYKCFNKDMTNRYGMEFEVGKTYTTDGPIIFGLSGNGYHMAERLEDTLKYFYADREEVSICLVKGSGKIVSSFDRYYDYYDLYAVQKLEVLKKLTRREILEYALALHQERLKRFISGFKLTEEEIMLFKEKYQNNNILLGYIEYYQEEQKDAFIKRMRLLNK